MVTWGVVEFALHTLRPNTIQREDQIVEVFKKTTETIWESHKKLQLDASSLSNTLQKAEVSEYSSIMNGYIGEGVNPYSDWLLVRDGFAQWWSDNLTIPVVGAMLDATSVLHSNDDGVYVIASSKWTSHDSNWQLLGSTKIFNISVQNSRFGDVYEASIPALSSMDPAPFYLEGSPDLLPFDHRFSIIRINGDFTTGHLALSTLDPGVRSFANPVWMYGLRTFFFFIVAFSAWFILSLLVNEKSELFKLVSQITFILLCGWFTVLLDIVRFWSGLNTIDKLFQESSLSVVMVHFAWVSIIFLVVSKFLMSHFRRERFFDHGTRFNKTSLILFTVGCIIGCLFWFILLYYNELEFVKWSFSIDIHPNDSGVVVVGFLWFTLVSTTFKLIEGLLLFIQKSVKYQVSWILQILITGHIYLFTILFIINYSTGQIDLLKSSWLLLVLPIGIWLLYKQLNEGNNTDSVFLQSLKLSFFPVLVVYPLYLYESFETLEMIQLLPALTGIWIRSFISSLIVVYFMNSGSSGAKLIDLNLKQLLYGHVETKRALTAILITVVYFISTPVAQKLTKTEFEQNYSHFSINQSNHHPILGSYEPGIVNLPVFESWVVMAQPDFEEMLDYGVFIETITNTIANTLNWSISTGNSPTMLRLYKSNLSGSSAENYQILATTVDSYPRIFARLSAIISSLSILAVLSIHLFLGITRKRSNSSNASQN